MAMMEELQTMSLVFNLSLDNLSHKQLFKEHFHFPEKCSCVITWHPKSTQNFGVFSARTSRWPNPWFFMLQWGVRASPFLSLFFLALQNKKGQTWQFSGWFFRQCGHRFGVGKSSCASEEWTENIWISALPGEPRCERSHFAEGAAENTLGSFLF